MQLNINTNDWRNRNLVNQMGASYLATQLLRSLDKWEHSRSSYEGNPLFVISSANGLKIISFGIRKAKLYMHHLKTIAECVSIDKGCIITGNFGEIILSWYECMGIALFSREIAEFINNPKSLTA